MTERIILPVESILERDVDLILLEELSTDNEFCKWFINKLNLPEWTSTNGVWRSISEFGLGETDILLSYNSSEKKVFTLIENKLDASFQKAQFDRYEKRAIIYERNRECDEAFYVLTAPDQYCQNQHYFNKYISYEVIAERLTFTGTKRNLF